MSTDFLRPYGRGGRWTARSTNFELLYPRLANAASLVNTGLAAWTWSIYFQLVAAASMGADFYAHAVHQRLNARPIVTSQLKFAYEVELATGAAGAEVTFARYSDAMAARIVTVGVNDNLVAGRTVPVGPTLIPSGTRISARIRCELADTSVEIQNTIYLAGYDGTPPASDPTYPLDEHLGGANSPHVLSTPSGSLLTLAGGAFPTYGAWLEVIASAAVDTLIWGLQGHGPNSGVLNASRHIQFGIGAAGSEVVYAQLGFPGGTALGCGQYALRRPLLLLAGERLAIRATGQAVNMSAQVLTEEL